MLEEILEQVKNTRLLLTSTMSIHLNINQQFIINMSDIFISFEKTFIQSISNRQFANGFITVRANSSGSFNQNGSVIIRVCLFFELISNTIKSFLVNY
jgi:hypothetical protein